MYKILFELDDSIVPLNSSRTSPKELKAMPQGHERAAAMQRLFLYLADIIRANGIDTPDIVAALLGAGAQDAVEEIEKVTPKDAAEATYILFKIIAGMVERMGVDGAVVGTLPATGFIRFDVAVGSRLCKNADVEVCRRSRLAHEAEPMHGSLLLARQRRECS